MPSITIVSLMGVSVQFPIRLTLYPHPSTFTSRLSSMRCFEFPVPRFDQGPMPFVVQQPSSTLLRQSTTSAHSSNYFTYYIISQFVRCFDFTGCCSYDSMVTHSTFLTLNHLTLHMARWIHRWREARPKLAAPLACGPHWFEPFRTGALCLWANNLAACPLLFYHSFLMKWYDRSMVSSDIVLR